MKIKRFFASEMREAIRQVKDELGADAVILSNNKVEGGIELVAAIDYDEEAVHRSLDERQESRQGQYQKERPVMAAAKKKRSVFAKVKKQKASQPLENSIQDDVISFSSQPTSRQKQVSKKQPLNNSPQENSFTHLFKQSVAERKQPFISDFERFDEDADNEASPEEAYPFDYESLVKEEKKRLQAETDDFFSTNNESVQHSSQQNSQQNNRRVKASRQNHSGSQKIDWVQDPALTSMQEEIKSLRGILENQLSGLAWGSFSRNHPHQAELLSRLFRLGIKSSLSEKIVKQLKPGEDDSLEDSWRRVLSIIARNIPVADKDLIDEGGIIALVGPTGVGKTTNIAKLAARFTLRHGAKNLALVTTDSYRVGAHEQLKTYGRILGVPVYVADDENELKLVLSRLEDKQLVLIDTAGMSHRDLRLTQQLSMLRHSHETIKILAVISASTQTLAMDEVIKTLGARELDGCITSKVDESTSIGGIISILIENKLQLNYISDGQKVPEDIHQANTTDLLKQALEMVRQHPVSVNTDELAMSYSVGGLAHAVG